MESKKTYGCPKGCHYNVTGGNCPRCGASMKYMGKHTYEQVQNHVQEKQMRYADRVPERDPRLRPFNI